MTNVFVAGLMLLLWLTGVASAASSEVHRFFHADADQASHDCVVSLISKGQLHPTTTVVTVTPPPVIETPLSRAPGVTPIFSRDLRLAPERAPPVASFPHTIAG